MASTLTRLLAGHYRLFLSILVGVASLILLPPALTGRTQLILGWDIGACAFLLLSAQFLAPTTTANMIKNAKAQEEGEWTLFFLVIAGATASFGAIIGEFGSMKGAGSDTREVKVALVASTLTLSWLLTQVVFALRYAHEFYSRTGDNPQVDGGLQFPGESMPDYWDFLYFSAVLGMTFQVSDVQITSRKLRRLATLHGLLGFVFNTVIVALTVNLASGLLS